MFLRTSSQGSFPIKTILWLTLCPVGRQPWPTGSSAGSGNCWVTARLFPPPVFLAYLHLIVFNKFEIMLFLFLRQMTSKYFWRVLLWFLCCILLLSLHLHFLFLIPKVKRKPRTKENNSWLSLPVSPDPESICSLACLMSALLAASGELCCLCTLRTTNLQMKSTVSFFS